MQKKISPKNTEEIVFINAHRKQAWPFRFAFKFLYITAIIFIICPFTDCAEENLHKEILKRVSMVNIDSIGAHLRRLQDFKTRYALSDSCRAAEKYLFEYFNNCGIDSVWYDTVFHKGTALRNVFASIKGNVDPDAVIICRERIILSIIQTSLSSMEEFLQALFISKRKYPIAYDKWIKEQLCDILQLPNLYDELVGIMECHKLESSEHIIKADKLEYLVSHYCKE